MDVIAHFDEIFLKGNNKGMFVKKLADNIRRLFKGVTVKRVEGGLLIENFCEIDFDRLALVPGIAKLAPALVCQRDIDTIEKTILAMPTGDCINSFRILASRSDKDYEHTSEYLNIKLGTAVLKKRKLKVNLKNPDVIFHVDIGRSRAVVYQNLSDGAGGLPTGTAGRVICLLSGGIDSPVAAYEMMKRGAELILVHFQNQTQVTDDVSRKILDLSKILAHYQPEIKLIIVPFAQYQKQVVMKIPADSRMLISRRLMFKLSELIAKQERAIALITGDSLGQVASQTLENLTAIYASVGMLKLAPLIGANKSDIVRIARRIRTFDISIRPYEDCCSLFVAKHPKTKSQTFSLEKLEKLVDFTGLDKVSLISYYISMNSPL
ncbi:MAG: tRNA 4-thiouridine(8) synthase ThiI [Candidatus Magasanikbacteria bacterium]|nr:tRNA 4-thiouridine(8) synthase ThiI [Candidatus Magasanikbacteria bacterium]